MKSIALVDVQGFKTDENKFIVKEISVVYNDQLQHLLILPPCPIHNLSPFDRKQVWWIEKNRKICWNEGFIPYTSYLNHVQEFLTDKMIYCKGVEKANWIKSILDHNDVINLEDMGCPKLLSLYEEFRSESDVFNCIYHPSICALKNVTCLKKWCLNKGIF